MFTGLVEAIGQVAAVEPREGDLRLYVRTGALDLADVVLGDSIAVNGVCLTAVALPGDGFWADVSRETLAHTEFAGFEVGMKVNLEKALTPSSRLGGHLVSGHVDGLGEVLSRRDDARSVRFRIRAPQTLARYIAHKGSICVDGVSLTVNAVDGNLFELNIVPHTVERTTIQYFRVGQRVNLEVDLIARYLERLMTGGESSAGGEAGSGLSRAFLAENGFLGRR